MIRIPTVYTRTSMKKQQNMKINDLLDQNIPDLSEMNSKNSMDNSEFGNLE